MNRTLSSRNRRHAATSCLVADHGQPCVAGGVFSCECREEAHGVRMSTSVRKLIHFSSKIPEQEDYYLTPATRLLEKRREMLEVENALMTEKEEFAMKMESVHQRREELERKEHQLKESLVKFDKFLKVGAAAPSIENHHLLGERRKESARSKKSLGRAETA